MEYMDLVTQHCPPAIQESVAGAGRKMDKTREMLLFSEITGVTMEPPCALGVVGELARKLSPNSSPAYKDAFLSLARRYRSDLQGLDSKSYDALRQDIGQAVIRILDDVDQSNLRSGILDVLSMHKINVLDQIDKRVDYKSLTNRAFLADWQFNEYAACMGDEEAPERLAKVLKASSPGVLRQLFTELTGEVRRKDACLSDRVLRELVGPYRNDNRVTADIDGDGPPVSSYANTLLKAL